MHTDRIAELLAPFLTSSARSSDRCHSAERSDEESAVLSANQLQCISTYIDILLRWNARLNLTAIRDPEEIVTRHFGESLFAARHLFPKEDREVYGLSCASTVPAAQRRQNAAHGASRGSATQEEQAAEQRKTSFADVGSGAGFPGIPIKLWAPHISLTLIESNHKKATFLREVTRALTLTDVNIQNTRAESLLASSFDLITLRAVERFESILPTAARLLGPQGRLALLISQSQLDQAHSTLSLTWSQPLPIPKSASRILLVGTRAPSDHEPR